MNRLSGTPVAFVSVGDRQRALDFYCGVLGLELKSSDSFGDFLEFEGALLRMTVMPAYAASHHPVLGWHVDDIEAVVTALRERGVAFSVYEGMGQDELGIWTAPDGLAKVAWFADPEGNVLSISQA